MDLASIMHTQSRDTLRLRQAASDPCRDRTSYATKDDADRHRLRGMTSHLCQRCYRFHYGPLAQTAAQRLFA